MPYQIFYGNPFIPGVGQGIFQGAKNREDFARRLENSKLRLEARRIDIEEARLNVTKTAQEIEQDLRDRELGVREEYYHQQARQWKGRLDLDRHKEQQRIREESEKRDAERFDRERATDLGYREEVNGYRSVGAHIRKEKEKVPDGYYERVDSKGYTWIVPTKKKELLDGLEAQWNARRDWEIRNAPAAPAQPASLPLEWQVFEGKRLADDGVPKEQIQGAARLAYQNRLHDDPETNAFLAGEMGLEPLDNPTMIDMAAGYKPIVDRLPPEKRSKAVDALQELFYLRQSGGDVKQLHDTYEKLLKEAKLKPDEFPFPWEQEWQARQKTEFTKRTGWPDAKSRADYVKQYGEEQARQLEQEIERYNIGP